MENFARKTNKTWPKKETETSFRLQNSTICTSKFQWLSQNKGLFYTEFSSIISIQRNFMKPEKTHSFSCRGLLLLLLSFTCFPSRFCLGRDTITSENFIKDPATITSNGSSFELGFFTPLNSTSRYVGIWFKQISLQTLVWGGRCRKQAPQQ